MTKKKDDKAKTKPADKGKQAHATSETGSTPNEKSTPTANGGPHPGTFHQPVLNIGTVGHVDHGKTTLTRALSGKWTDTHSEEIKRGITIRLGYADITIYECATCPEPDKWSITPTCLTCKKPCTLNRIISLVDAPGHESLMATMLSGANIMDGALLLIAANETCPQPQTREHVTALDIMGLDNVIVVQNKIDLVNEEQAKKNHEEIKAFLANTRFKDAPIIPISAQHGTNIDALLSVIQQRFPTPKRDDTKDPLFYVARSFDTNRPGTTPAQMTGGILGGALKQGKIAIGQDIDILPGYETTEKNQKVWKPLTTTITALMAGGVQITEAHPGGTFGIQTTLDPHVVKSDKLVGSVVGVHGKLPPVWSRFKFKPHLLDRVVGAKDELVVEPIKMAELLMLNINSSATVGHVKDLSKGLVTVDLRRPVCADVGSRLTISRAVGQRWRLIGYGEIQKE